MYLWLLHFETISTNPHHEYIVLLNTNSSGATTPHKPRKHEIASYRIGGYELQSCTLIGTEDCRDFPSQLPTNEAMHKL